MIAKTKSILLLLAITFYALPSWAATTHTGAQVTGIELNPVTNVLVIHYTGGSGDCSTGVSSFEVTESDVGDALPYLFQTALVAFQHQKPIDMYSTRTGGCNRIEQIKIHRGT